jgi:spore coat polysaccharide biosynthesis protein SpsF (cytidylyltransferase family)
MGKTVAIIQARMGSKRLPGKVLRPILGKPILALLLDRLSYAKRIDHIVVATSVGRGDDPIADLAEKLGFTCFRGSEADVMDRVYQAALAHDADPIVRITADCPLLDPTIIDHVINAFFENNADLALNSFSESYPDGLDVEVFSLDALTRCWHGAPEGPLREHLYSYILRNSNQFKIHHVLHDENLTAHCWSVDDEVDFEFIEQVCIELHQEGRIFLMNDVLDLLERRPELRAINASQIRNTWKAEVGL